MSYTNDFKRESYTNDFKRESYTNDFKRELREKIPELTNKVPSDLEGFRRPKWTFLIGNVVRMV